MSLSPLIAAAQAQDLRPLPDQEAPTRRRLLPRIDAILARLSAHRAEVDAAYAGKRAALRTDAAPTPGEATLAHYPVGFCHAIRDQVFDRLRADREFHALIGPETVLKKVFVLLKGRYFQNALQLGNLYVDVANDTVFVEKPKLEWCRIEDLAFENADAWPAVAAVGRRYYGVTLFPNLLFPLAFPVAPYFAIRASGRIDLFQAQDILFLKDLGEGFHRARALLADPAFPSPALPEPYPRLLREACGANLREAFPVEFSPCDVAALRDRVLPEFDALARRDDSAAAATVQGYLRLVNEATVRLARLDLRPDPAALAALRAAGHVPAC